MYNATKAIKISTTVPCLRVQPVRHIAAKTVPREIIHRCCIAQTLLDGEASTRRRVLVLMLFSRHPPTDLCDALLYGQHARDFLDDVVTTGVRKDFSRNDRN